MTTIFINTEKRVIVSDTRMTTEFNNGSRVYSETSKVFKSNCGKFIISGSGNVGLLTKYINDKFKIGLPNREGNTYSKGDSANVLITNPYNKQVKIIKLVKGMLSITKETSYASNDFISVGSGSEIVGKLWSKVNDPVKIVRYAAMKDKYTNDKLEVIYY